MPASLQTLSPEILLHVAHYILDWDVVDGSGGPETEYGLLSDIPNRRIPSKRPPEPTHIGASTLRDLGRTCSHLYNKYSTLTLRHVLLHNTYDSGEAVKFLSSTPHAGSVTTLHFMGDAPGNKKPDYNDVQGILPENVQDVLANINMFPNLSKIIIDLDIHLGGRRDVSEHWDEESDVYMDLRRQLGYSPPETEEELLRHEGEIAWRALQARTFVTLVESHLPHTCDELEIRMYPVQPSSVFGKNDMNDWLGRFRIFSFVPYADQVYDEWTLACWDVFLNFVGHFDLYFLHGLTNVEEFYWKGDFRGCVGKSDDHEVPLPLRSDLLPKLRKLHLRNYFFDEMLLVFLVSHSEILQELVLANCWVLEGYVNGYRFGETQMLPRTWADYFKRYCAHKPSAIESIAIEPRHALIHDPSPFGEDPEVQAQEQHIINEIRASRHSTHPRILFRYGTCHDKYGDAELGFRGIRNSFNVGRDQAEWDELMNLVRVNRRRRAQGLKSAPGLA